MSLIEQAAKRLAELQRAGAELPEKAASGTSGPGMPRTDHLPTPEALVREVNARRAEWSRDLPASGGADVPASRPPMADDAGHPQNMVEIDLARLKGLGFVTPDAPQSTIAHEFRVLKRPIIRNARGGRSAAPIANGMLVMVTSALPGEGKTFTAINLAISMSMEFDNSVLLVDGDVAHPTLLGVLGLPPSPGLLDLLTGDDTPIGDVLLHTNLAKLTVLPAGTRNRNATELLASEKMTALLRDLSARFPDTIILFDSPPLLATTEARVLATHMGQIVMVVEADSTSRHTVNHALATIERCNVVMMLLNKAVKTDTSTYYGYYADDAPA